MKRITTPRGSSASRFAAVVAAVWLAAAAGAQAPSIAGYNPYKASVGATISVTGNNLNGTTALYFNGTPGTNIQVTSQWGLKVVVPPGATTGKLKVVTPKGEYTTSSDFVVDGSSGGSGGSGGGSGTLNIATFTPWHGAPGDQVTFTGSGFAAGMTVHINNIACTNVQVVNASTVKATIAPGTFTGKIKVTVGGTSYTTSSDFIIDGSSSGGGSGGGVGAPPAFINPPNIPVPAGAMTGHPRIFVRQADLPMLQSWANGNNSVWTALVSLANVGKTRMDTNAISDQGYGGGNVGAPFESYAQLFAFMSMVHPDAATRADFATRAHTLLMKVINEAAKGQIEGQPFRAKDFAINNRASWFGESFPLTVDWIYHKFSAEDKVKIRRVFLRWIQENLRANTTNYEHPKPYGVYNDPSLVDTFDKVRWATNNYYANHARSVGLMAMALDDVDDVPAAADEPAAGTLRKFVGNAIQAWLYQAAKYETTVGAGGISPEGLAYGELSSRAFALLMLGMHTTGVDNPAVYGANASHILTPYWQNELPDSYMHLMSPSKVIQESWIGPTYVPYLFSDTDKYRNVDYIRVFGPLAIHARNTGDTVRYAKLRWMMDNLVPGGAAQRAYRISSAFDGSSTLLAIMYFLATDPNYSGYSDPRPTMPTEFWAPGLGILSSRTDWTPDSSWFVSKASWNSIDHQFGDANSIAFWRGGEWLTKPHLGYGAKIACSDWQNTLAIENPGVTNIAFWNDALARGSQFAYNNTQDPTNVVQSSGPTYAFTQADTTALYNNVKAAAMDVQHASRSTVFLKPDMVVTYDRAKTGAAGRYKRYWLNTPAGVSITGRDGTMTTAAGQRLFISTLLPTTAVLASAPKEALEGQPAQMDPMTHRFCAEDPAKPAEVRFLNVLQGANAGGAKIVPTTVLSSAGVPFEGTVLGTRAVMFKRDLYANFTSTTFTIPATVTERIVTGLAPNAGYTITTQTVAGNVQITITAGGATTANAAGLIKF
ncbi:MAG: IPT/TIG domain-containing protein [Fimbriimonas sp.]